VHLAYEWRVLPSQLAEESPRMLATMYRYLRWRAVEQRKAGA
jgi:hypothetical protein